MNKRAGEIVGRLHDLKATDGPDATRLPTQQTALMGELMAIIAKEQAESAEKLEKHTVTLIIYTDNLNKLTRALVIIGIATIAISIVAILIAVFHG
jgi:hypothetical protein